MVYFNISNCLDDGLNFYYKGTKIKLTNSCSSYVLPINYENITVKQLLDNCKFYFGSSQAKLSENRGIINPTSTNAVSFPSSFSYNASEKVTDNTIYYIAVMGFKESNTALRFYYYKKSSLNEVWDTDYAKGNHSFDKYKYSSYILIRDYTTYGSSSGNISCCYDIKYPDGNTQKLDIPYLVKGFGEVSSRYDLIKEVETTEPAPSYKKVKYRLYGVKNLNFGTQTVTWTTGVLWWKKNHSATVTSYMDVPKIEMPCLSTYTAGNYYPTNMVNPQDDAGAIALKIRGSSLSGNYEDFNRLGLYMEPGYIYVFDVNFMMTSTKEHLEVSNYINHDNYRPANHKNYFREGFFYKTTFDRGLSPTAVCDWAVNNITNKINSELK